MLHNMGYAVIVILMNETTNKGTEMNYTKLEAGEYVASQKRNSMDSYIGDIEITIWKNSNDLVGWRYSIYDVDNKEVLESSRPLFVKGIKIRSMKEAKEMVEFDMRFITPMQESPKDENGNWREIKFS